MNAGAKTERSALWTALGVTTLLMFAWPSFAHAPSLDLSTHLGKVVYLDFWASWCVPCRRSFPWMNQMQEKYGDEALVVIAVNLDNSREDADAFLAEFGPRFEIYFDSGAEVAKQYGVKAMPTSFIIGRNGAILHTHYGFRVKQTDEYEAAIIDALGKSN